MTTSRLETLRAEVLRSLQLSRDAEDEAAGLVSDYRAELARLNRKPVSQLTERELETARSRAEASPSVQRAEAVAAGHRDRARTYALAYLVESNYYERARHAAS